MRWIAAMLVLFAGCTTSIGGSGIGTGLYGPQDNVTYHPLPDDPPGKIYKSELELQKSSPQ